MRTFVSGGGADYLSGLRDAATALADGAGEFAYQLDYTNLMIVLQVVAFLAEWAITLVMWSWNPIGAAIEQAFLEELFKVLFGSTLRRFLTHAAMTVVTNLALSTALDGLARWVLALQGEHTTQGDEYRHSAVLSGAVQGAFGAAVPLLTGPVKKLISKGFSPAAVKAMQEGLAEALEHPASAAPVRSAASDAARSGASDLPVTGEGRDVVPRLGVGGHLPGSGVSFASGLAALAVPMRVTLLHDVASAKAQNTFRAAVAQQFTTAFGTSLGTDTAHTMGMAWANAFLTHAATGKNLAPALKTALQPMEALGSHYTPLRTALSDKVAAALPSAWKDKPAHLLIDTAFSAGHQNLSEGIVNYIEQGTFTTTKETTIGAMGGDILGHAKHPILTTLTTPLHLNLKIPSLLTTPPTTSINTATADTLTTPPTTTSPTPTPTPTTNATTLPTTTDTTAFTPLPTSNTNINVPTPNSPNSPNTLQPTPTPATGTPTPAPTRTTPNATTDTTTPPTRITTTSSPGTQPTPSSSSPTSTPRPSTSRSQTSTAQPGPTPQPGRLTTTSTSTSSGGGETAPTRPQHPGSGVSEAEPTGRPQEGTGQAAHAEQILTTGHDPSATAPTHRATAPYETTAPATDQTTGHPTRSASHPEHAASPDAPTSVDKGKARAIDPGLVDTVPGHDGDILRTAQTRPLTASEADTLHDHLRDSLGEDTYRRIVMQASGIVGRTIDIPVSLDGGLADTNPAAYTILTHVTAVLAQHDSDPAAPDLARDRVRTLRDQLTAQHAPPALSDSSPQSANEEVHDRTAAAPVVGTVSNAGTEPASDPHTEEDLRAASPATHLDQEATETGASTFGTDHASTPDLANAEPMESGDTLGETAVVLSERFDESDWWRIYVPVEYHGWVSAAAGQPGGESDPGAHYDAYAPGHREHMLSVYADELEQLDAVARPVDAAEYARLFARVVGHATPIDIEWSGHDLGYPLTRSGHVGSDLLEETLLGRRLVTRQPAETGDALVKVESAADGKFFITGYRQEEIPRLIDAVFARHYEALANIAPDNETAILATIARTVRTLTVLHLTAHAEQAQSVHSLLLLPKLLLQQGFPPVSSTELQHMFEGDHTVQEITRTMMRVMAVDAGEPLPRTDSAMTVLSEHMPEKDWWRLYIDPQFHSHAEEAAQKNHALMGDPGMHFDVGAKSVTGSPGYQHNMLRAYREVLNDPDALAARMNSTEHRRYYRLLVEGMAGKFTWSRNKTAFPLRNDIYDENNRYMGHGDLSPDILDEKLLGQRLVAPYDASTFESEEQPITIYSKALGMLNSNHSDGRAAQRVDAIYDRYHAEIENAGSDRTAKLNAIARAVRALMVIHAFTDANSRLNIRLVLPKLLLQNGLPPVYHPDFHIFFQGGYSIEHITRTLSTLIDQETGSSVEDTRSGAPRYETESPARVGDAKRAPGPLDQTAEADESAVDLAPSRDAAVRYAHTEPSDDTSQRDGKESTIAEHVLWQRLFRTPEDRSSVLADIASVRGTDPSAAETALRHVVFDKLTDLPGVTVVVGEAANFGHQAAATMLLQSLTELGYGHRIRMIAPDSVRHRLDLLLSPPMRERVDWLTDEFDNDTFYPPGHREDSGHLVLVAANDALIDDGDVAASFLNFVGADRAVILKPYAWSEGHRLLYTRNSDGTADVTNLQGERGISQSALYHYEVPRLSDAALEDLISEQAASPAHAVALVEIARAVSDGRMNLMPAYGLHNLHTSERASSLPALAEGIHRAGLPTPTVIFALGNATVDHAPQHRQTWLHHHTLGSPSLPVALAEAGPGDVLIVKGGSLPQELFRQIYQLGTLPAIVEGANTTNALQLQGRPYFSVRADHTPYDPITGTTEDREAVRELTRVTEAIVQETEWGREQRQAPVFDLWEASATAISTLKALQPPDGPVLTVSEADRFGKVITESMLDSDDVVAGDPVETAARIVGTDHPHWDTLREFLAPPDPSDYMRVMRLETAEVVLTPAERDALVAVMQHHHDIYLRQLGAETADYSVTPQPDAVTTIAGAIRDASDPGTTLGGYFHRLALQAHHPDNDQVLQALTHLFTHTPGSTAQRTTVTDEYDSDTTRPADLDDNPMETDAPTYPAVQSTGNSAAADTDHVRLNSSPSRVEDDEPVDEEAWGSFGGLLDEEPVGSRAEGEWGADAEDEEV
ncbi:hypothetical protein ABTY96_46855, partial [Streptomyces sp. NPDC096057]